MTSISLYITQSIRGLVRPGLSKKSRITTKDQGQLTTVISWICKTESVVANLFAVGPDLSDWKDLTIALDI